MPHEPIFSIPDNTKVVTVDLPADFVPGFLQLAATDAELVLATTRPHRRSLSATGVRARFCVDVLFPGDTPDLSLVCLFQRLRRDHFPARTYWARQAIVRDRRSKLLELTTMNCLSEFWPLCTELLVVGKNRALVYSGTAELQWVEVFNRILRANDQEKSMRLKWRPSCSGGRVIAKPRALDESMAAARRLGPTGGTPASVQVAEVVAMGQIGREDQEIITLLMRHVIQATGLELRETDYTRPQEVGEFANLARGGAARPGRIRILVPNMEGVRKIDAALRGQHVAVGGQAVSFRVVSDGLDAALLRAGV